MIDWYLLYVHQKSFNMCDTFSIAFLLLCEHVGIHVMYPHEQAIQKTTTLIHSVISLLPKKRNYQ